MAADRGVTEVLGAMQLFLLVFAVIALVQLFAVPALNAQIEFDHNQRVQADFHELNEAVLETAGTSGEGSVAVEYGTAYPSRLFFFNPPATTGNVRTVSAGDITIEHAVADGEAGDYLNGTWTQEFTTRHLEYEGGYHEYRSAPATVYEYPVTYNRFADGGVSVLDGGNLVRGRTITLVAFSGDLDESGVAAESIHTVPLSAPAQSVAVTGDGGPLTIRVPTTLDEGTWETILEDELEANGGYITSQTVDTATGHLVLTFKEGETYNLRLGHIGLDPQDTTPEDPVYIVVVSGDNESIRQGELQQVVVEVRDRFNNPVSNAQVAVNDTLLVAGTVDTRSAPVSDTTRAFTDEDGRATFTYRSPQTGIIGIHQYEFSLDVVSLTGDPSRADIGVEVRGAGVPDEPIEEEEGGPTTDTNPPSLPTMLNATADDSAGTDGSAEQVTFHYKFIDDVAIEKVTIDIYQVTASGTVQVGDRTDLPAEGPETVGLDLVGKSNSYEIDGSSKSLDITVTATDTSGNTVTCTGNIDDANDTIDRDSAPNGGSPFTCTTEVAP